MKILAIHNFHRTDSASGDDQVFKNETALLEAHGNEVVRYTVSNDVFDGAGVIGKVLLTFGMLWSFENYRAVQTLIKREKPDIVHIHTFFPLLSPSILYAAKRLRVPVVATLHDTRFVCPCSTSLRGNELCNECGDGKYFRMCRYGCFKGSRLQSFAVACIFKYHRMKKSFYRQIDKYICLNEKQISLLKEIGFDRRKIVRKYNFVPDAEAKRSKAKIEGLPERYVVFYGRIGEEKGIRILMQVWDRIDDIPLVVMGGGPLEKEFRMWADRKQNVYFLGYTKHDLCLSIVKGGEFVIFPSIFYEGCSMVEIEAESLGKGLIATDLGFSAEAIENGVNGYKITLGDVEGFIKKSREIWAKPEMCQQLGENARKDYEAKYLPEDNYLQLMGIYRSVVGGDRGMNRTEAGANVAIQESG